MTEPIVTLTQARTIYREVCRFLGEPVHPDVVRQGEGGWPPGPVLVAKFESTAHYGIAFEGGPYEWPRLFCDQRFERMMDTGERPTVHVEPVNTWSIGIYPN